MSTPALQPVKARDLTHVATAADAVEWLNQRAAEYLVEAEGQSPDDARGMRLAASTLEAVAEVSREWRDDVVAADGLSLLARSYPEVPAVTSSSSEERYYRVACGHIADTLSQLASRLNHAVAPERARRASAVVSECAAVRGRDL